MARDGGIGTYLQQLVPRIARMRPDWAFTALGDPGELRDLGWHECANVRLVPQASPIFSIREQLAIPASLAGTRGVYWAPYYNVPFRLPVPLVVTIHDVNHLALPELMGSSLRRVYARMLLTSAVRRARRLLFDSEFTRVETERLVGGVHDRGTVVHLGVSDEWKTARLRAANRPLPEPYFLYLGNVKRHKNVPLLLRAFERIAAVVPHRMVLIGRREGLRADPALGGLLERLGERAIYLGELDHRRVEQHVVHADALVTASLYEGFGFPPLEAMAAGCPCMVSRAGSLPEICGDAALYCDPRDEGSVADGLLRIARDDALRADLVRRGHVRAAEFRWERTADATAAVIRQSFS